MINWFRNKILSSSEPDFPSDDLDQNNWIRDTQSNWQRNWHNLFDQDDNLSRSTEFLRPDPIPHEIASDFRLIFGLTQATASTQEKCFSLLPKGDELFHRFRCSQSNEATLLSEDEAVRKIKSISQLLTSLGHNLEFTFSSGTRLRGQIPQNKLAFGSSDHISILFEDIVYSTKSLSQLEGFASRLFLTEPLYAAAGNHYELLDWVTGALIGGSYDKIQHELFALWSGGWIVSIGENVLLLSPKRP